MRPRRIALAAAIVFGLLASGVAEGRSLPKEFFLAEGLAKRCEFAGALQMLERAPKAAVSDPDFSLLRVRLLIQLERHPEAIAAIRSMKPPVPGDNEARASRQLLLGLALAGAKELEPALAALKEARELGADEVVVLGVVGMAYAAVGKLDDADIKLRDALKADPLLSGALYNLGVVRAEQGRLAEAAALVRQSWYAGLQNPRKLKSEQVFKRLIEDGLLEDLVKTPPLAASCQTY